MTGSAPSWLEALNARSDALNREHGLGGYGKRRALGQPGPDWREALQARSDAMNRQYGLGDYARKGARTTGSPDWLVALNARSDALNRPELAQGNSTRQQSLTAMLTQPGAREG